MLLNECHGKVGGVKEREWGRERERERESEREKERGGTRVRRKPEIVHI